MKIFIDAGHGKDTLGKRAPDDSMREFEFNSAVCNYIKEYFKLYPDVDVMFSHSFTTDVRLQDRTNYANKEKADLFVSIHANAFGEGWNDVRGIESFVYTSKPPDALKLASYIQNELIRETGQTNRGVKTANFHVLRETNMTAILIECGFMTNKEDLLLLKSDAYRQKCALAIVNAIASNYKLEKVNAATEKMYTVQVGAFRNRNNALAMVDKLKEVGIDSVIIPK
jgi:N-acetylmuramoyl-L-alanine amidase